MAMRKAEIDTWSRMAADVMNDLTTTVNGIAGTKDKSGKPLLDPSLATGYRKDINDLYGMLSKLKPKISKKALTKADTLPFHADATELAQKLIAHGKELNMGATVTRMTNVVKVLDDDPSTFAAAHDCDDDEEDMGIPPSMLLICFMIGLALGAVLVSGR